MFFKQYMKIDAVIIINKWDADLETSFQLPYTISTSFYYMIESAYFKEIFNIFCLQKLLAFIRLFSW